MVATLGLTAPVIPLLALTPLGFANALANAPAHAQRKPIISNTITSGSNPR